MLLYGLNTNCCDLQLSLQDVHPKDIIVVKYQTMHSECSGLQYFEFYVFNNSDCYSKYALLY